MNLCCFPCKSHSAAVGFSTGVESSNTVGYNNTVNGTYDNMTFIGASFKNVGNGTVLPFNSLGCVEGLDDGDQIQTSSVDQDGIVQFKVYVYWDGEGWADDDLSELVDDTVGFALGQGGWFISAAPKQVTTSGEVKKTSHIHTFSETMSIATSAFPVAFCPNSADVSWACEDGDQLQVPVVDQDGIVNFKVYVYWDGEGWADDDISALLDADTAIVTAGKGFWFIAANPASASFTEVSPIAD